MLGFFVVPYQNESFYSLVARFCNRFSPIIYGLKCLFGDCYPRIRTDLATDLEFFQKTCGKTFSFTSSEIYHQFTLWPLYKKFLTKSLVEEVDDKISAGGKYVSWKLMARSRNSGAVPYYCPSCNKEQREKGEELYWNRVHQIPNIKVCPYHFTILEKAVLTSRDDSSHLFIPSEMSCPIKISKPSTNKFVNDVSITLKKLLLIPDFKLGTDYQKQIKFLGYLKGESLDFEKLRRDFESLVGINTIKQYEAGKKRFSAFSKAMIYGYKNFVSPANHSIFKVFLDEKSRQVNEKEQFRPFGKGPWKCINKCCPSYNKDVIEECKWHCNKDSKNFIGYFKCDCGLVYYQSVNIKIERRETRVTVYGELWENKVKALLAEGNNKQDIAREIGCNFSSGYRGIQKLLGHIKRVKKKITKKAIDPNRLKALRKSWRNAVKENIHNQTLTVIRGKHFDVYSVLVRRDSPWLKTFNSPFRAKTRTRKKDVNRSFEEIEKLVINEIERMRQKYPPVKITRRKISIALGIALNKQISLPRFIQLLDKGINNDPEYNRKIAA